ncbi:MAG: hypothetical protein ACKVS9_03580, partial [Phycisphaerae bacterium]
MGLRIDPDFSARAAFDIEADAVLVVVGHRHVHGRLHRFAEGHDNRLASVEEATAFVRERQLDALPRQQDRKRLL